MTTEIITIQGIDYLPLTAAGEYVDTQVRVELHDADCDYFHYQIGNHPNVILGVTEATGSGAPRPTAFFCLVEGGVGSLDIHYNVSPEQSSCLVVVPVVQDVSVPVSRLRKLNLLAGAASEK